MALHPRHLQVVAARPLPPACKLARILLCIGMDKDKDNNQLPEPPKEIWVAPNYDTMWGVSGYYLDNDGNDIRDRD